MYSVPIPVILRLFFTLFLVSAVGSISYAQQNRLGSEYHSFGLEFRLDLIRETTDDKEVLSEKEVLNDTQEIIGKTLELDTSIKFKIARARMNFIGKVNDKTKYRVRILFNKSFDAESQGRIDNTGEALQYWYLDRRIWDFFLLRVGKIKVLAGAIEQQMYNEMDLYHSSRSKAKLDHFEVGGELTFKLFRQTMKLQLVNSPLRQSNQSSTSGNMGWFGSFGRGLFETVVTGGVFPSALTVVDESGGSNPVQEEIDAFNQYHASAGLRMNLKLENKHVFKLEAEALHWTQDEFNTILSNSVAGSVINTTNTKETILEGQIYGMRYEGTKFHVLLRYSTDDENEGGKPISFVTQFTSGIEYFPEETIDSYRVHVIYISEKEVRFGDEEVNTTLFNIGVSSRF